MMYAMQMVHINIQIQQIIHVKQFVVIVFWMPFSSQADLSLCCRWAGSVAATATEFNPFPLVTVTRTHTHTTELIY